MTGAGIEGLRDALLPAREVRALISLFYEDEGRFAGRTFVELRPNEPDRVSAEDLLAVTFMGEIYPPYAVRQLLDGSLGRELSKVLGDIPSDRDLWQVDAAELDGSPTDAWRLLRKALKGYGVGSTKISKLLARKRPALIPIHDSVIGEHIAPAETYWRVFHEFLQDEGHRRLIEDIRPKDIANEDLPLLRVLDTAVWMRYSRGRPAIAARAEVGL